jgi:hypothetical protein
MLLWCFWYMKTHCCPLIVHNHCFISDCMLSKPAIFNFFLLQTTITYRRCTCTARYCSCFQMVLKSLGNVVKYCSILLLAAVPSQSNFRLVSLGWSLLQKYLLTSCLPRPVPATKYCTQMLKAICWQGTTLVFPH